MKMNQPRTSGIFPLQFWRPFGSDLSPPQDFKLSEVTFCSELMVGNDASSCMEEFLIEHGNS